MNISDLINEHEQSTPSSASQQSRPLGQSEIHRQAFPVSSSKAPAQAFSQPTFGSKTWSHVHHPRGLSIPLSTHLRLNRNPESGSGAFHLPSVAVLDYFSDSNPDTEGSASFADPLPLGYGSRPSTGLFSSFHPHPKVATTFYDPSIEHTGAAFSASDLHGAGPSNLDFYHRQYHDIHAGRTYMALDRIRGHFSHNAGATFDHGHDDDDDDELDGDGDNDSTTHSSQLVDDPQQLDDEISSVLKPGKKSETKSQCTGSSAQDTDKKNKYVCCHCNKSFSRRFVYRKHIDSVHLNYRPFACNLCDKRFTQKNSLIVHQKGVHFKEKSFYCDECSKGFTMKGDLVRHVRTVHMKLRPFACEECGLKFGLQNQLTKHIRVVHDNAKQFKCTHCSRFFRNSEKLESHITGYHFKYNKYKKNDQEND